MRYRIVDVETTGVEPTDRVVEIGSCDLVDGEIGLPISALINPGILIPPSLSAIHHIIDEDVAGAKAWPDGAHDILGSDFREVEFEAPDVYVAHNAKFERQWITDNLTGGKPWICTYRCALRVWPVAASHSNQALRYWLKPEGLDRTIAHEAHRAAPDAYVTAFTLRELLKHATFEQLVEWSAQPALMPRCRFPKHRDKLWSEVPRDYIEWVVRQPDMDEDSRFSALEPTRAAGRDAAAEGTETLRLWFVGLSPLLKQHVKDYLDASLKPIAAQSDEIAGAAA